MHLKFLPCVFYWTLILWFDFKSLLRNHFPITPSHELTFLMFFSRVLLSHMRILIFKKNYSLLAPTDQTHTAHVSLFLIYLHFLSCFVFLPLSDFNVFLWFSCPCYPLPIFFLTVSIETPISFLFFWYLLSHPRWFFYSPVELSLFSGVRHPSPPIFSKCSLTQALGGFLFLGLLDIRMTCWYAKCPHVPLHTQSSPS